MLSNICERKVLASAERASRRCYLSFVFYLGETCRFSLLPEIHTNIGQKNQTQICVLLVYTKVILWYYIKARTWRGKIAFSSGKKIKILMEDD
jgi:hypothetical protein